MLCTKSNQFHSLGGLIVSSRFCSCSREQFLEHVARMDSKNDQVMLQQPSHRRRPRERPRSTWLRRIDADVKSASTGINSAWRKANDHILANVSALQYGHATETEEQTAYIAHYCTLFFSARFKLTSISTRLINSACINDSPK